MNTYKETKHMLSLTTKQARELASKDPELRVLLEAAIPEAFEECDDEWGAPLHLTVNELKTLCALVGAVQTGTDLADVKIAHAPKVLLHCTGGGKYWYPKHASIQKLCTKLYEKLSVELFSENRL